MKSPSILFFAVTLLVSTAARADFVWTLYIDDDHAFMGVIDERDLEEPEAHYPFAMSCSSQDGETIVVSDVDAVALGEAIAGGDVPTYKFILDGDADNPIGHIPDIHFAHMEAVWEYVTRNAPYYLLEGANAIRIEGVGVSMALPEADFARSLAEFGSACQRIIGDR